MGAPSKKSARKAFDLGMQDAEILVELARLLSNHRKRRIRREPRERLGSALALAKRHWDELECLENERVFVTYQAGHAGWRDRLTEPNLRLLLRQALVAACADVETLYAYRGMESGPTRSSRPSRLLELSLTVDDYLTIDSKYVKKRVGAAQGHRTGSSATRQPGTRSNWPAIRARGQDEDLARHR